MRSPTPETPNPPPFQSRRRAKTRPALLAAGVRLLAVRPVDSLTIDEIVEAAGVAKGSFFYHFADKQSFAREIAASLRSEVETRVGEINAGITDPARRVARGMGQFVAFALKSPDQAAVVINAAGGSVNPRHPLNAGLRADLSAGLDQNRFDFPDLDAAMLTLIGVTNLLIGKVLHDRPQAPAAQELLVSVLTLVFRGLGVSALEAGPLLAAEAREILSDETLDPEEDLGSI